MNKKHDKEVIFLQLTENGQPATNIIITSHFALTCFGKLINDISVFKYCNEGTSTAVDMAHLCLLSCILYRYAPSARSAIKTTSHSMSPTCTFINTGMCYITGQLLY